VKSTKREHVDRLLYGPLWDEAWRALLKPLDRYPKIQNRTIKNLRSEMKKEARNAFGRLISYKPSNLVKALFVEAWIPPAELFLSACRKLAQGKGGFDYQDIQPQLQKLGFGDSVFGFLNPHQPLRYLLQSTPRSLALKCVAHRSEGDPEMGPYPKRLSEEDLDVAHSRIFPAAFRKNWQRAPQK
jgi:hypothetical protein